MQVKVSQKTLIVKSSIFHQMKFANDNSNNSHPIISIGHVHIPEGDDQRPKLSVDGLPLIATRNLVLFPNVTIPIRLGRENSLRTAQLANKRETAVGIVCQVNPDNEAPTVADLHTYGVIADILQVITMPDDTQTAIVRGREKFKIVHPSISVDIPEAELAAAVKIVKEVVPKAEDKEFSAMCDEIKRTANMIANRVGDMPKDLDLMFSLANNNMPPVDMINTVATHFPDEISSKMAMLRLYRIKERAMALLTVLTEHEEMMNIAESVHQRAKESFDDQQRRTFLQRQMEAIDKELNGDETDVDTLKQRGENTNFPEKIRKVFDKELDKLCRLNQQTPDYSVQFSYLETLLDLPWQVKSEDQDNFAVAEGELDKNHYGLEKVKERILEQIAVMMNNPEGRSPILCLVGPPGVGKTSLGQSVANALGRKFQRISLGGLHDEAEIRGHRRTYIGAMPGRIIEAIKRAGTSNPVLLLDEIDKIGNDYKGDPASALLEVLDPEQNCRFHDNYIDVDFDLSKVLFIATANNISNLAQPLIDRMEVIDLSGYLLEEKVAIAKRHLIPKVAKDLNIEPNDFNVSDDAITSIIEGYTAESGVRQLEKNLASIARKIILRKMSGQEIPAVIEQTNVKELLGIEKYNRDKYEGNDFAGVVTGLAWTAVGGEILFIESSLTAGKGEKLTLTGNLGDVMKESAVIALQYVRSHASLLGIPADLFDKYNLHIHVPEGAIPKDGPSAGVTMATSIASVFTQRKIKPRLAMTGEITLRGKILPVGGIKEKILAAKRAGITDIILSGDNRKDVDDINSRYRDGLTFHFVETVPEVISLALTDERAVDAINL